MLKKFIFAILLCSCAQTSERATAVTEPQADKAEEPPIINIEKALKDGLVFPEKLEGSDKKVVWHTKAERVDVDGSAIYSTPKVFARVRVTAVDDDLPAATKHAQTFYRGLGGIWGEHEIHMFESEWTGKFHVYEHDGHLVMNYQKHFYAIFVDENLQEPYASWIDFMKTRGKRTWPRQDLEYYSYYPETGFQKTYSSTVRLRYANTIK